MLGKNSDLVQDLIKFWYKFQYLYTLSRNSFFWVSKDRHEMNRATANLNSQTSAIKG